MDLHAFMITIVLSGKVFTDFTNKVEFTIEWMNVLFGISILLSG